MGYSSLLVFFALCLLFIRQTYVIAVPLRNITISAPEGTSDHGDPALLCTPAKWSDVITFILANYVAHAGTVNPYPGEHSASVFVAMILAIIFPSSGIARGLTSVLRFTNVWVYLHRNKLQTDKLLQASISEDSEAVEDVEAPERRRKRVANYGKIAKDLQLAAQSGALCMVVRSRHWKPRDGDGVSEIVFGALGQKKEKPESPWLALQKDFERGFLDWFGSAALLGLFYGRSNYHPLDQLIPREDAKYDDNSPRDLQVYDSPWATDRNRLWYFPDVAERPLRSTRTIHGFGKLPSGYDIEYVPRNAIVYPLRLDHSGLVSGNDPETAHSTVRGSIICSKPYAAVVITIFQLIYASVTLYQTPGDQTRRLGYAAFGLTVAPYLIMSFVNLLGNLITPNYPVLYMVRSEVMDEAEKRTGVKFNGCVGELRKPDPAPNRPLSCKSAKFEVTKRPTERDSESDDQRSYVCKSDKNPNEVVIISEAPSKPTSEIKGNPSNSDNDTKSAQVEEVKISDTLEMGERETPMIFVPSCPIFDRSDNLLENNSIYTLGKFNFQNKTSVSCYIFAVFAISLTSLAIIGGLSRFQNGESTRAQRTWTMTWFAFGSFSGLFIHILANIVMSLVIDDKGQFGYDSNSRQIPKKQLYLYLAFWTYILVGYSGPAVGGFIVVVQMIYQFGTCTRLY